MLPAKNFGPLFALFRRRLAPFFLPHFFPTFLPHLKRLPFASTTEDSRYQDKKEEDSDDLGHGGRDKRKE